MSNKVKVQKIIESMGYKLGCYTKEVDTLTKPQLTKVIKRLKDCEETETIKLRGLVVSIDTVDMEKDITMLTTNEYKSRYGEYSLDEDFR